MQKFTANGVFYNLKISPLCQTLSKALPDWFLETSLFEENDLKTSLKISVGSREIVL